MYLSKSDADSRSAMKSAISLSGRSITARPIQLHQETMYNRTKVSTRTMDVFMECTIVIE